MKIKRILCFILVLIFAMTIVACGKGGSDDDDDRPRTSSSRRDDDDDSSSGGSLLDKIKDKDSSNDGGSKPSEGDAGSSSGDSGSSDGSDSGSGSGDQGSDIISKIVRGKSDADAKLTIYKLGENSVVFVVEGSACAAVIPKENSYYGDKEFYIEIESMGIKSTLQSSSAWWQSDSGDYFWGNDDETMATPNLYFTRMNAEGIASKFNLSGDYIFVYKNANSGTAEGDVIKEGKAEDLVKTMTEEEYDKLVTDSYMKLTTDSPAQADWTGTYTLDYSYDGSTGFVTAEITEGGLIHFHLKYNNYEKDIFAKEKDYDAVEYVYGKYVSAAVEVIGKNRYNKEFNFKQEPDSPAKLSVYYSDYEVEPSVSIYSESFTKLNLWHIAPDDYADEDTAGYISALDLTKEPYKPINDNYTISYDCNDYVWDNSDKIMAPTAVLRSFDANDMVIQEVTAYIAANEDDARRIYQQKLSYAYDTYNVYMSGNIVYSEKNVGDDRYESKMNTLSYWYVGCRYAYQPGFGDEYSGRYYYINRPFTSKEYDAPLEYCLYWKNKGSSTWRSMDYKDVNFYEYINNEYMETSIYGSTGVDGLTFESSRSFRVQGMNAIGVTYYRNWKNSAYEYYVVFRTYEFTEEVTNTTDYFFKVDSFDNVEITFDNFLDKTPDLEISQRFDMTRPAN